MINSFKAEWRKLRQRPAVWWLGAFIVGLIVVAYFFSWVEYSSSSFKPDQHISIAQLKATLYPNNFANFIVAGTAILGGALMLVMGALAVGSEYGWTTFKTIYAQRPSRLQILGGEVSAISAVNAIVVVGVYAVAAISSTVIATVAGASLTYPALLDVLKAMAATWVIFEVWTLFGMSMAYLFRQSALAIGLGLAYMLAIEGILFRFLGHLHLDWLTTIQKFMVGQNAGSLANSFPPSGVQAAAPLVSVGQALLVIAVYAIAFVIVSSVLVRTRDVV